MKLLNSLFVGVGLSLVVFSACKKEEAADWSFSTDDAIADVAFQDVYTILQEEAESNGDLRACPTVSLDQTTFPINATIDFGTTCTAPNGRIRSGILNAEFTGRWRDAGSKVTIVPSNFKVNNYKVEGKETITNNGTNAAGQPNYTVEIQNGKVTNTDNETILRAGTQTYTWIEGYDTPNVSADDAWSITGSMNGTTRDGKSYTVTVLTAVEKAVSCKWPRKGVLEITNTGTGSNYQLDFSEGGGGCDGTVKITYGALTFNYTMM